MINPDAIDEWVEKSIRQLVEWDGESRLGPVKIDAPLTIDERDGTHELGKKKRKI